MDDLERHFRGAGRLSLAAEADDAEAAAMSEAEVLADRADWRTLALTYQRMMERREAAMVRDLDARIAAGVAGACPYPEV